MFTSEVNELLRLIDALNQDVEIENLYKSRLLMMQEYLLNMLSRLSPSEKVLIKSFVYYFFMSELIWNEYDDDFQESEGWAGDWSMDNGEVICFVDSEGNLVFGDW